MSYVTAFGLSLLAAMLLTPAVIRGGLGLGLCDLPNDTGLKIHSRPVPDSGGLGRSLRRKEPVVVTRRKAIN